MVSFDGSYVARIGGASDQLTVLIPQVFQSTPVPLDKWAGRRPVPGENGFVVFINGDATWPVWIGAQVVSTETTPSGGVIEVVQSSDSSSPEVWVAPGTPPDPEYLLWYDTDAAATVGLRQYAFSYQGAASWPATSDTAWQATKNLTTKVFDKDNLVTATSARCTFTAPRDGTVHFHTTAQIVLGSETTTGFALFLVGVWQAVAGVEVLRGSEMGLNLAYLPPTIARVWMLSCDGDVYVTAGSQYYPSCYGNAVGMTKTWNVDASTGSVVSQFSGRYIDY